MLLEASVFSVFQLFVQKLQSKTAESSAFDENLGRAGDLWWSCSQEEHPKVPVGETGSHCSLGC